MESNEPNVLAWLRDLRDPKKRVNYTLAAPGRRSSKQSKVLNNNEKRT
jgi:hypothetical protein